MGFIREQFGRITVESRRESFMIHVEDASLREPSSEWWTADLGDLIAALTDYRDSLAARDTRAALAGLSAEATPDEPAVCDRCGAPKGLHAVGEPCNQNCGGKVIVRPRVVAPPPNPLNPYPFHEPLRVEHHSDEDKRQAWDEGYAAGVAVGQSLPSTGTGWDRGYAAGVAAERDQAWRWTIHVCPKGHKSLEPPLDGVCWKCWPGGQGPAEEHIAIRVAEVRR